MGFDAFYLEIYDQAMFSKSNESPAFITRGSDPVDSVTERLIVGSCLTLATCLGALQTMFQSLEADSEVGQPLTEAILPHFHLYFYFLP